MNNLSKYTNISKLAGLLLLPYSLIFIAYPYAVLEWLLPMAFLEPAQWTSDDWVAPGAIIAPATRAVYFCFWILPLLFGLFGFWHGGRLLWWLRQGVVFDTKVARAIGLMGVGVLGSSLAHLLAAALSPRILSWHNPEGPLALRFWYSTEHGGLIICGLGFVLISAVMREAVRLSDENDGFI